MTGPALRASLAALMRSWGARYLAWWLFAGALAAVLHGVGSALAHGYPALGFWRNALLALHESLPPTVHTLLGLFLADALGRGYVATVRRAELDRVASMLGAVVLGVLVLCLAALSSGELVGTTDGLVWEQRMARLAVQATLLAIYAASLPALARPQATAPLSRVRLVQQRLAGFLPLLAAAVALAPDGLREALLSTHATLVWAGAVVAVTAFHVGVEQAKRGWAAALGVAGAATIALLWAAPSLPLPVRPAKARPRSVVLIAIDTLRYDALDLDEPRTEHERDRTPNLRAFADTAAVFTRAMSSSSWTLPSFASVHTGRYPRQHGATNFEAILGRNQTTLAEYFREAGYATTGVISHLFVDRTRGLGQGFDALDESCVRGHQAVTGEDVTNLAIEQLQQVDGEPFFLWVHYFDTHYRYVDHEDIPWADDYKGILTHPEVGLASGMPEVRLMLPRLEARDLEYMRDLYDEEIAYTDRQVGRLIRAVEAAHPDAVIALVADHGEEFAERGWLGHTVTLHEELVHVPLIVRDPKQRTRREVTTTVETRALFGSLLELSGLGAPADAPTLVPLMRGERMPPVMALSEVDIPQGPKSLGKRVTKTAVRSDDWALLRDHLLGQDQLFDLRMDPSERVDLLKLRPEPARALAARVDAHAGSIAARTQQLVISGDTAQQLRALGYGH